MNVNNQNSMDVNNQNQNQERTGKFRHAAFRSAPQNDSLMPPMPPNQNQQNSQLAGPNTNNVISSGHKRSYQEDRQRGHATPSTG